MLPGVAVGDATVVELKPVEGDHEYVAPAGCLDTLSVVECVGHIGLTAADAVTVRATRGYIPVSISWLLIISQPVCAGARLVIAKKPLSEPPQPQFMCTLLLAS